MNRIEDTNVWITDIDVLEENPEIIEEEEIDFIVNLSSWCDGQIARKMDYLHVPIRDGQASQYLFDKAVDTVVDRLETYDDRVLVHCAAGISRSVAVATTALCYVNNTKFPDQLGRVKRSRPQGNPNPDIQRRARNYLRNKGGYNIPVDR